MAVKATSASSDLESRLLTSFQLRVTFNDLDSVKKRLLLISNLLVTFDPSFKCGVYDEPIIGSLDYAKAVDVKSAMAKIRTYLNVLDLGHFSPSAFKDVSKFVQLVRRLVERVLDKYPAGKLAAILKKVNKRKSVFTAPTSARKSIVNASSASTNTR